MFLLLSSVSLQVCHVIIKTLERYRPGLRRSPTSPKHQQYTPCVHKSQHHAKNSRAHRINNLIWINSDIPDIYIITYTLSNTWYENPLNTSMIPLLNANQPGLYHVYTLADHGPPLWKPPSIFISNSTAALLWRSRCPCAIPAISGLPSFIYCVWPSVVLALAKGDQEDVLRKRRRSYHISIVRAARPQFSWHFQDIPRRHVLCRDPW